MSVKYRRQWQRNWFSFYLSERRFSLQLFFCYHFSRDNEDIDDIIDDIQDEDEKEKIKKKKEEARVVIAKCLGATKTVVAYTKNKPKILIPMEPVPMVGGPGSLPPQYQPQKVGGPGSLPPQAKLKVPKPEPMMVGGPGSLPPRFQPQPKIVGGPDSIPDFLKKDTEEAELKDPKPEAANVLATIKELMADINKFSASLEATPDTTMWEVRFWVDVVRCFRELLNAAQKAVDDDPAASKQIGDLCSTVEQKIRQYFIVLFREPNLKTRKLIYQIFSFKNREITQPIVDLIVALEDESSDPEDPDNDHPEIFDGDVILLCEEPRLRGLACFSIDVTVRFFQLFYVSCCYVFNSFSLYRI